MKTIAATNDVGDDGIVDGSSAITKTMRIRACLIGRQIRIPFDHGVSRHVEILQMSENSVAAMNQNLWEILVRGQTNANVAM